jgi:hypothetical protein
MGKQGFTKEERGKARESRKRTIVTQKEAMLKALSENYGLVKQSAEKAGITRKTHYKWLEEDSEYRDAVELMKENNLDIAEYALMKMVEGLKDASMIKWFLETHGASRGYGKKVGEDPGNGSAYVEIPKVIWVKS